MAVNVRERERDVLDLVVQFRRLDRLIRTIEQFSRSLCSRRREFRLLTLDIICRKKRRGIRFVIKNIVSIGSIFFFFFFFRSEISQVSEGFLFRSESSAHCARDLYLNEENRYFCDIPCVPANIFLSTLALKRGSTLSSNDIPSYFDAFKTFNFL